MKYLLLCLTAFLLSCVGNGGGQNPVIPGLDGPHVNISRTRISLYGL